MAFFEDDRVEDLDRLRSAAIFLAAFFIAVGGYLLESNPLGGGGMVVSGVASGVYAIYVHKAYKSKTDVRSIRKKLGYD